MNEELSRERCAVRYIRVGGPQDSSDTGIARQRAACEHIAQRHGLTIVREYVDRGTPARLTQQTELRRLLVDLEQHRDAAYVIVANYARLGRDLQSLDDVIQRIRSCDADIATITGVEVAERFTTAALLDQVAEWARKPVGVGSPMATEPEKLAQDEKLNAAVELIRRGRLNADQREALANLVSIAGSATLPTPVAAAVFNVVQACKRTTDVKKPTHKNEGREKP